MNSPQSIILGITGCIAGGKSEAGHILSAEGFKVLDCDFLAHELMEPGQPVYQSVVDHFGRDVLSEGGQIDRRKMAQVVFENPAELSVLNQLVHPAVIREGKQWVQNCREAGEDAAVLVPLLFEAGWTDGWDAVFCILTSEKNQVQRLEHRGMSRAEAHRRINAQMPPQEKAGRSDFVIENDGTLDALRERLMELVDRIRNELRKSE